MTRFLSFRLSSLGALVSASLILAACGGGTNTIEASYPTRSQGDNDIVYSDQERETLFSQGGLFDSFGMGSKKDSGNGSTAAGIGVNALLWRASLDSISFMPLASADPFGGTIITDWYQKPSTPNERVKMNILILSKELRADALRVDVFRQTRDANGQWQQATVADSTPRRLSDMILRRARDMRQAELAD